MILFIHLHFELLVHAPAKSYKGLYSWWRKTFCFLEFLFVGIVCWFCLLVGFV